MFNMLIEEYSLRLQVDNANNPEILFNSIKIWLEKKSDEGYTILHYAAFRGNIGIIKKLYEYNVDAMVPNIRGVTPFHMAAQGDSPNSLVYLKKKFKVNIQEVDNQNTNALQWACYNGRENSFIYLVSFDMSLNDQNSDGLTSLHLAILSENTNMVKKLIQRGADITIKDYKNRTAFDLAVEKHKLKIIEMLKESEGCQLCICHNPVKKTDRSNFNVYLFIFLHVVIEGVVFFILMPSIYNDKNRY